MSPHDPFNYESPDEKKIYLEDLSDELEFLELPKLFLLGLIIVILVSL